MPSAGAVFKLGLMESSSVQLPREARPAAPFLPFLHQLWHLSELPHELVRFTCTRTVTKEEKVITFSELAIQIIRHGLIYAQWGVPQLGAGWGGKGQQSPLSGRELLGRLSFSSVCSASGCQVDVHKAGSGCSQECSHKHANKRQPQALLCLARGGWQGVLVRC